MTGYSRLFLALTPICLPLAAALLCATNAHAGWIDDAFTFREEQKPLVQPRRNVRPKEVVQPYYPNDEHVSWSNFYTRTDLEAQDYLSSSASKVMRPPAQHEAARTPAQAQGGWPAIAEQAAENAMAEAQSEDRSEGNPNSIMIGDPGEGWGMAAGDAKIGRATRVGPAVQDWRGGNDRGMASRPGDYDYRAPVGQAATTDGNIALADGDTATSARAGGTIDFATPGTAGDDPRYVGYNDKGQVDKYAVQKGDTLSSISGQPAIYGTWKLWPLIYSANRRAIGGNPINIKPAQRLDIPRDYTEQQAQDAERRAGR